MLILAFEAMNFVWNIGIDYRPIWKKKLCIGILSVLVDKKIEFVGLYWAI